MLGYACLNMHLREKGIFSSRTARLATVEKEGSDFVKKLVLDNLNDLLTILKWNEEHGYRFMRISSELTPHFLNPRLSAGIIEEYTLDFAKKTLKEIGDYAKSKGHRLTFHPAQFCILSSPDPEVVNNSIRELTIHADILKLMGLGPKDSSCLIFHGGGTYNDKQTSIVRLKDNLRKLPTYVLDLCALENDERSYDILDLLPICEELNILFVIDVFHYLVMNGREEYDKMLTNKNLWDRVHKTWTKRNMRMKIHISSQRPNSRPGAHADTIDFNEINLPKILCLCKNYNSQIMVEAKYKEIAMQEIYDKYFTKTEHNGRVEWILNNIC